MRTAAIIGVLGLATAITAMPVDESAPGTQGAPSIQSAKDILRDESGHGHLNITEDGTLQSIAKDGTVLDERFVGVDFYETQLKQLESTKTSQGLAAREELAHVVERQFNCGAYICEDDWDCAMYNCALCLTAGGQLGTCFNWY